MKIFRFLAAFFVAVALFSCSSSSDDASSSSNGEYFNLNYEGAAVNITQFQAQRSEQTIAVTAVAADGLGISFEINELGDIGNVHTYPTSSSSAAVYDLYSSYRNYPSHYFTLNLIELNSQAKTVEVSFTGDLYEDQYVLGGNTVQISGSFKVRYTDIQPMVNDLGFRANIGGNVFMSATNDQSGGFFNGSDIALTYYNNSEYTLTFNSNHDNTSVGTYNFNNGSTVNNVIISKFDTATQTYVDYLTSGTLTITEKIVGTQFTVVKGTFSFTATNPENSTQITVSGGDFVSSYETY
ncbi:hypothetical protein [Flavobacterium suncheonense]|uniref:Lipoprotein n=1 Tax=Flavobacterium suncheonense GH29-5 = DSM 17707 TaxID=1121899 RepID=A0A0A2MQF0_9FLAO|nr:hypothetical protein [Flavobacterium suncheonense]KGO90505.1 hypothetical protein Q764_02855 [Flavobacterium suncheonense GH29-5 = DSM 17707]